VTAPYGKPEPVSSSRAGHVQSCLKMGGPPSKPKYSSVTDSGWKRSSSLERRCRLRWKTGRKWTAQAEHEMSEGNRGQPPEPAGMGEDRTGHENSLKAQAESAKFELRRGIITAPAADAGRRGKPKGATWGRNSGDGRKTRDRCASRTRRKVGEGAVFGPSPVHLYYSFAVVLGNICVG